MKKFFVLIMSLLLTVSLCTAGCAKEIQAVNTGGGSVPGGSTGTPDGTDEGVPDDAYTVTLALPDGDEVMPDLTGIQAVWTNSTSVYTADFDENGFAYYSGLDGEYTVTVSGIIDGYTYNPNIYRASGTEEGRKVVISLIILGDWGGGSGDSHYDGRRAIANYVSAYRVEFTKPNQKFYFEFSPITNGSYVYSLETFVNVTENEINPKLDQLYYSTRTTYATYDGGSDYCGSYTKNVKISIEYYNNRSWLYALYIDSTDTDYSTPKYVDIYFKLEGDYDVWEDGGGLYKYAEPESYNSDYEIPQGKFYWLSDLYNNDLSYCGQTKLGDDGFYYILYEDEWHLLFFELGGCHFGTSSWGENPYYDFSNGYAGSFCQSTRTYYFYVINAYKETGYTLNSSVIHPVTPQIRTFLYDFSCKNYDMFFDGLGELEKVCASNEANQWMVACGIFI